ncbi:QacE family quaternary ammonium compound efflux SMR transporter [Nocardioides mangrovicus]|uniref:QacE family quaternary ammonium compound efflux SMR transporter n=1 Tax=Nocardioides mangrovicus TaxID=2478913 RepID=A0A3L8P469_9ACTN|nr:multidrug efflux SMR transporter [Nocardioides mangrovicus]RLV49339.1 QacE family quaternary ammonium compound efflux SMR transporter [Nocardioides mangrovicus]
MWTAGPLLVVAIAIEVGATAVLPRAKGFTDPFWAAVVLGGYAVSIWLLAVIVRYMDVSVVYAIWSGAGTAAIAVVGVLVLGERLDLVKVVALTLIIVGVVVLNLHGAHHRPSGRTAGVAEVQDLSVE